MILLLLFLGPISAISKESIKRHLNSTIGLCIVYPDDSLFNITQNRFFQTLINSIQGPFTLSTYPYSEYSLSDKSTLSERFTNIIITRENQFLEHYQGNFSLESISREINQVFYSYVELLNESSLQDFKKDTNSLFLLTGPTILKEFEDAAFFYKNTKARFGFLYQNSSTDSFVSLYYIKNKHNISRIYDGKVPMIQFIRSCKSQFSSKNKNKNFQQLRLPKHSVQLVAISNRYTDYIQDAFTYLNESNYKEYVNFDVVSWKNATELMEKCQIKRTRYYNSSFIIYPKFINNTDDDNNCFVFQDMDFYSKELLYFFISKTVNFYNLYSNIKVIINETNENSYPLVLSRFNFSKYIPGENLSVVFIECQQSFSNARAKFIFSSLSQDFKSSKFKNHIQFCRIQYHFDDFKLPSADSFPTFAIFKPFNKQAIVFNQILTFNNLKNWILKIANENDDDLLFTNDEIELNTANNFLDSKQTDSISQDRSSRSKNTNNFGSRYSHANKNKQKFSKRPKIVNIDRKNQKREMRSEL